LQQPKIWKVQDALFVSAWSTLMTSSDSDSEESDET